MGRKKTSSAGIDTAQPPGTDLSATVEALTRQVELLTGQVEILRQVLDEIRDDFQWALQNDKLRTPIANQGQPIMHITSLPKDACAKNWEINRVKPEDLPPDSEDSNDPQASTKQAELWD